MINATFETIYMVFTSFIIASIIGFPIGIILMISAEDGLSPNKLLHRILDLIIVNITRSIPFVILIVLLIPLSRIIVGKSYGTTAFIIPLSLGTAPFIARIVEGALKEVDKGLIEACKSMGANNKEIIFKMLIPEAIPVILHGMTLTIISLVGYSAIAGTIGGGGLGNSAVIDGYQRGKPDIMWKSTIIIIIMVQIIQYIGDLIVRKIKERRGI